MIRNLILTAVLATGGVAGVTATASARPPAPFDRHDHDRGRFQVLIGHHGHWDLHGTYRDRDDARRVARRLERGGFDTRIERVGGG